MTIKTKKKSNIQNIAEATPEELANTSRLTSGSWQCCVAFMEYANKEFTFAEVAKLKVYKLSEESKNEMFGLYEYELRMNKAQADRYTVSVDKMRNSFRDFEHGFLRALDSVKRGEWM
jgi:hypothetical protein